MLGKYRVNGEEIDSLDLKSLIISKGIKVSNRVYERFGESHRIYPDPLTCNCLLLPDQTVVQMTDVALHLKYVRSTISLENLKQMRYFFQISTPFRLDVSDSSRAAIFHNGEKITEVDFPAASQFYNQVTSTGLSYLGNAVLQGTEWLSFQCLWTCDYAKAGYPCQFCYSGMVFEQAARKHKPPPPTVSAQDVAEITDFAVMKEKSAKSVQLTGGSTMDPQAECDRVRSYLECLDSSVGLKKVQEILVYTTPPSDPKVIDRVFEAGADRVACSLEVWDEELAKIITPGKWKFTGRKRHLDCLRYISKEYGPNKACSTFVVGVEPAESYLAGAEYLASEGIVPIASVWIPFGRPVMGKAQAPGLEYYRKIKEGLADIYTRYGIEPPGGMGLNVCLCRDAWNHRSEILKSSGKECCSSNAAGKLISINT